jgi:hypothetical protein
VGVRPGRACSLQEPGGRELLGPVMVI